MRLVAFVMSILYLSSVAVAAETPWQDHQGMLKTRLVSASGDLTKGSKVLLAWEADLAPGWKTYWRSPGEAGLPVRVSVNGEPVDIEFPYPHRFELFGLETYGYADKVMLPFYVSPPESGMLAVKADFMVCKDICVPFEARYELAGEDLAPEVSGHDIRLEAWLAQVPTREGDAGGLRISSAKVTGTPGHQRIVIEAEADSDLSNADMLAEAGEMFHFGAPQIHLLQDGTEARFVLFAMTGKKPKDLRGQTVRLTFADGGGRAIDKKMKLEP
ncbi:protein-disulfide reductase DsbD domain-containing protein [Kordiimonas aestuarii]|uniref:protein-disulfide reductase DsbD domain-containing protein n=1 Tax=Kordiimonas aestuarii TaxID=1005925 RepID=UPI0021D28BA0|nr:protein-disulfide reductase DsbD domain-containing protein [Kordiimonas aestuarii]